MLALVSTSHLGRLPGRTFGAIPSDFPDTFRTRVFMHVYVLPPPFSLLFRSTVSVLGPVRLPAGEEPSRKVRPGGARAHHQDARSFRGSEGASRLLRALAAGASREGVHYCRAQRTFFVFCVVFMLIVAVARAVFAAAAAAAPVDVVGGGGGDIAAGVYVVAAAAVQLLLRCFFRFSCGRNRTTHLTLRYLLGLIPKSLCSRSCEAANSPPPPTSPLWFPHNKEAYPL